MLLLYACAPAPRPLSGEAVYVWQASWSLGVLDAVSLARAEGLALYVLHAEITEGVRRVAVPDIGEHAAVVRIGVVNDEGFRLGGQVVEALARSPEICEIQVDADVPTARLAEYAAWLGGLDVDVPLTVSGLPDWLQSAELPAVLAAVDGWTLQVHAPPRDLDAAILGPRAGADLARALALGEPLRLALPAYGVGLAQDREGVAVGVVGEGARFEGVERWADPVAVAERVRDLPQDPAFLGVIWFRLPVEGDRWTWSPETWKAVRAGQTPEGELHVEVVGPDLRLRNRGDGDSVATPVEVTGEILAFDAVGGWSVARTSGGVRFSPPSRPIRAHAVVPVGWVRGDWSARLEVR